MPEHTKNLPAITVNTDVATNISILGNIFETATCVPFGA
jgi:hypothetical protein